AESEVKVTPKKVTTYRLPSLDLLNAPPEKRRNADSAEELRTKAALLEETLESFNVEAKVVNVISGPSVTRYEIEPARGVKVSSITKLSDDLALNMRAKSIRIEAPIPGKAAVGIEIENEAREMVTIKEIIGSDEFKHHKSKLAFAVGRDIGGKPVVADLGKMPHMLIAGATGSGKSVCINTIIASILYKARPEEVKLVLIDPKMVELGNYNGIPHLLIPVVTDCSKAAAALQWAVAEMTERYKKFAAEGVRDIGAYNLSMNQKGEKEEILPQIVVIIDELADLMMVASSQVEDAICRLAQLARAAGMHLILATQRPSVDVITGLIKANVPSRIAFMVSSQIDSRTIIDMAGAEKLVGNGDMLFKPQDLNKPKRIQGPFVSDDEVRKIIDFVKQQGEDPEYSEAVMEQIEKGNAYGGSEEEDELFSDAVETVVLAGQASVSMLQRRFRIGYNRAARIIDMVEDAGIIGAQDGSRPRQVLMSEAELIERKEEGI
ncbi:MAG: DNA translocase FtsK, partial [Anaerovoracaceae bacterium]